MSKKYKLRNKKGSGLGLTVEIGTPGLRNQLQAEVNARNKEKQVLVNNYLANLNDYKFANDYTLNSINNLTYEQVDKLIQTKILLQDLPFKKLAPKKTTVIKVGKKNLLYMGKINDTITEIPGFFGFGGTPLQKVGNVERNVYLGDDGNFYLNKYFGSPLTFFPKQVYIEYKNKKPSSISDPNYSPNNQVVQPQVQLIQPQQQGPPPQPQGIIPKAGGFLPQDPKIYIFSFNETYAGGNKKKPTTKKPTTKKSTTKKPTTKKPTVKKTTTKKPTVKNPTTKKKQYLKNNY